LKVSPSLSDDANGSEVDALRSEFYDVYSKCSNTFNKYKKISLIFKSSPCSEYEERVEARIWNVETPLKKIEAYQEGIATLTKIMTQMAELDTTELGRMYEKIKSFNAQHKKLEVLLAKRENLKSDIAAILENMDEYQSKAESYMADASLNCAAEPVDFDCGNRCQQRVKDPIFGTYRNEPDMRCLKNCNFQEQQAIADLNEKIDDCIDDRDWAKEKLEGIESDYDSERARGLALSREHNQINDELKLLVDRNKNAVGELDSFLAQLPPEIFNTMNNEFSAYGLNSMSYRTD
jgi:predicted nuclease with TOPRIM domain